MNKLKNLYSSFRSLVIDLLKGWPFLIGISLNALAVFVVCWVIGITATFGHILLAIAVIEGMIIYSQLQQLKKDVDDYKEAQRNTFSKIRQMIENTIKSNQYVSPNTKQQLSSIAEHLNNKI